MKFSMFSLSFCSLLFLQTLAAHRPSTDEVEAVTSSPQTEAPIVHHRKKSAAERRLNKLGLASSMMSYVDDVVDERVYNILKEKAHAKSLVIRMNRDCYVNSGEPQFYDVSAGRCTGCSECRTAKCWSLCEVYRVERQTEELRDEMRKLIFILTTIFASAFFVLFFIIAIINRIKVKVPNPEKTPETKSRIYRKPGKPYTYV